LQACDPGQSSLWCAGGRGLPAVIEDHVEQEWRGELKDGRVRWPVPEPERRVDPVAGDRDVGFGELIKRAVAGPPGCGGCDDRALQTRQRVVGDVQEVLPAGSV